MKIRLIIAGFVLAALALAAVFFGSSQTLVALSTRDLEMLFVVTDAETGEPISNATIRLMADPGAWNRVEGVFKLVTDRDGRSRFVHENNSCEDIIRPYCKTVTHIDLTWATIDVSANGYKSLKNIYLHTYKYDNKGYIPEGGFQRVEFKMAMQK